jgi:hypothetical protein
MENVKHGYRGDLIMVGPSWKTLSMDIVVFTLEM